MLRYQPSNQNKGGEIMDCKCNGCGSVKSVELDGGSQHKQSNSNDCHTSLTAEYFMI